MIESDEVFDPDRLAGCAYWRCDEIFEQRTSNHQFCRKACRSRHHKWARAQVRKQAKADAKAARAAARSRR
jgi:hypothetical protein